MLKLKYLRLAIIPIILLAVVVVAVVTYSDDKTKKPATSQANNDCGPYRKNFVVHINGQAFNTEEVTNDTEAAKGLSGRPCILPNQAMLFVYTVPGQYSFWMKDMKFPIDMIWIGSDRRVAWAYTNVSPKTYPSKFVNPKNHLAQLVLEVKANTIKRLNIQLGTPVQISNT